MPTRAKTMKKPTRKSKAPPKGRDTSLSPVSDERVIEKTGKSLAHWFKQLDRFGAKSAGHTATARHLVEEHSVPSWYAQSITVAYERAHGIRAMHQISGGSFGVSVSKVVAAPVEQIADAFNTASARRTWLPRGSPLTRPLAAASAMTVRDPKSARMRWRNPDSSITEVSVDARPGGKAAVVAQTRGLSGREVVETLRPSWRSALEGLKSFVEGGSGVSPSARRPSGSRVSGPRKR